MKFGNSWYLILLIFIPFIAIFYYKTLQKKETKIKAFASLSSLKNIINYDWKKLYFYKSGLILFSITLMIFSLAQPQYGFREETIIKKGTEIVVAVDVSKSMLAEDIKPNRLERAKRKLNDLIRILQGDKVALVAFAGTSFLECPLTVDYEAFQIFLDYLEPALIPVAGTSIGNALETSIKAFSKETTKNKSIILITDGEDQEDSINSVMSTLKEKGIKVFSIGIGKGGGAPIPTTEGLKTDESGKTVLTKLDTKTLENLSKETGGLFIRSVSGDIDIKKIYDSIKASMEDKEFASGKKQIWENRFQIFLGLVFLLLVFESFLGGTKKKLTTFH